MSSDYFNVMRIPLRKGRSFTDADNRRETPGVVIINEALQRRYWPQADPLERRVILSGRRYQVVGVAGNVKHDNLTAADTGELYIPQYQGKTPPWTFLVIRSDMALTSLVPAVRQALHELLPAQPIYDTRTLQDRVSNSIAPQQFNATMLAVFAAFALLLATIGIYGVVAFAAQQRTREMGIRLAVGAQPDDLLRLVVGQGLKLGFIGVSLGVAGALVLARMIASLLYNTGSTDPVTFGVVATLFLGIATVASYFPARRAARVDPVVALRCE